MRFAIDVVFMDAAGRVLHIAADVRPWRIARCRGAQSALELRAGEAARVGVRPGMLLGTVPEATEPVPTLGRAAAPVR